MAKQGAEHVFEEDRPDPGQFPALPIVQTTHDPERGGSLESSSRRPPPGRVPGSRNKRTLLQGYCEAIAEVAHEGDRTAYLREIKEKDPRNFAQLEMHAYKAAAELELKEEAQEKAASMPRIRFVRADGSVFEETQVIDVDEQGNADS